MKPKILISRSPESSGLYEKAVEKAGGEPLSFHCPDPEMDFDALILAGGGDVDPSFIEEPNRGSYDIDLPRDRVELALVSRCVYENKPILGICRGHQILNVALGGTLIQHLPTADAHAWTEQGDRAHPVTAEEGTFLHELYGRRFSVNSAHHQAVEALAPGLTLSATADDGTLEAFQDPARELWCVQFHPERMCFAHRREDAVDGADIFRFFLARCAGD